MFLSAVEDARCLIVAGVSFFGSPLWSCWRVLLEAQPAESRSFQSAGMDGSDTVDGQLGANAYPSECTARAWPGDCWNFSGELLSRQIR